MTNNTQDPFGSIPIADDEEEAGSGEQSQPFDPAPPERPADEEPAEKTASPAPPPPPRRSRRKRQRRISDRWWRRLSWLAAIPAAGFVLYLLAGYFAVPYLLENVLPARLARTLERPVTVGAATFNPFTLTVTLQNGIIGPRLADPAEGIDPLLSFGRLELDLAAAGLLRRGLIGEKVTVHRLIVHLVRREDSTYNLQELLPPGPGRFRFSLNNISIRNSRLLFDDRPTGATHTVEEIDLALPSLGNLDYRPERFLSPRFAAKVNGSPLQLAGETKATAEGSEARLTLRLEELDLPRYFAYLPLDTDFTVSKGRAELDLDLLIRTGKETDTRLQIEGTGRLTDVWLQSAAGGKELARLPAAKGIISFAPLGGRYRLKELVLQQPEFLLERDPEGRWLLPRFTAASGSRVEIDRLRVTGGKLSFVDRRVPGGFADTWADLHLTIEGLAGDSGKEATFALSGRNRDQARLSAQGRLEPEPLRAEGIVVGHRLQLAAFNPYFEAAHRLRIEKNGMIPKLEGEFTARAGEKGELKFSLRKVAARIENLALARQQQELLRLPEIAIDDAAMEWPERRLVLGSLEATGGLLLLDWDAEGRLNWASPSQEAEPWQVAVKAAELKETNIHLRTRALPEPLTLQFREAAVTLADLTTREGSEGRLEISARLFGESPVELAGPLGVAPFGARLAGRVDDLSLLRLKPAFSGWFRPTIRKGALQAEGELRLPEGVFRGAARIDDFVAAPEGEDLLRCRQMSGPALAVDFRTGTLRAPAIALDRPFAAWTLAPKGGSSLGGLFDFAWTTGDGTPRLALDRIEIEEGELAFSDPAASPPYAATVNALSGSVAPLVSTPASHSLFELAGRSDQAHIAARGELQPFADEAAAVVEGTIRGLALSPLSPYLNDQLGYRLAAGTLDLAASLQLAGRHLQATNRLDLEDLTLGEPVDRSSRLPLAVALLTDRNGRIELDIPVEGETGTPDFSYREELRRSIRHLLLRTTVSPFSFLADAAPHADLREYLTFPDGRAELTPEIEGQLETLARVLAERPRLKIVLKGFAGDQDRQAIRARKETEEKARRRVREAQQTGKLAAAYGKEENRIVVTPIPPETPPLKIEVTDELLLELASGRSENIQRYLLKSGIPEKRVAVAPAGGPVAADAPGRPASRVEIGLEALQP